MLKFKKFISALSILLVFTLALTLVPLSTTNAEDLLEPAETTTIDLSVLSDDEFALDSVLVILKKEYSNYASKFNKSYFADVDGEEINNLMDSENNDANEFRDIFLIKLKRSGREEVIKAIEKLKKRKEVKYAGPNLKMDVQGQFVPNDPDLKVAANIKPYNNMSLPAAWDITVGSRNIVVANNECIQYTHDDLSANMWSNPNPATGHPHGYNSEGASIYPLDGNGHGTITAGVIGAVGNNGKGSSGVAQQVSIMSVPSHSASQFAQMINYLNANKVEILNISLGWGESEEPIITQSILNYNGLVTISAGNGRRSDTNQGIGYNLDNPPSNARLSYPAIYGRLCPNVITVAAVDNNDNLHGYSNFGTNTVAIAASADIQTTNFDNSYISGGGTSSAAPVVAGTAALIKSIVPSLNWRQVKEAILNNVDVIPTLSGKIGTGGRLNIYKAVSSVVVADGTYYVRNVATGKCLGATTSSDKIEAGTFAAQTAQQWKIANRGNHYYTLSPTSNTTKYWNVTNALDSEGNSVGLLQKNDAYAQAQSFQFVKNNDGTYRIISQLSSTRCLSINSTAGSNTMLSTINENSLNQKWVLEQFETKSGTYYIRNLNSGLYLDVESPNFVNVIQHSFNGADNQKFKASSHYLQSLYNNKYLNKGSLYSTNFYRAIVDTSTPIYYLKNSDGSYCIMRNEDNTWKALDVYNGSKSSGTAVGWYSYTGSANQKWAFEEGGQATITAGTYYLKNKNSGYYLDLNESTGGLIQYGYIGGNNQKWEISKTSSGNYKLKTKSTSKPGYISYEYASDVCKATVQNNNGIEIGIYRNNDGTYRFMMSGYTYALVVRYGSMSSGAEVFWNPYCSTDNEQWILVPA